MKRIAVVAIVGLAALSGGPAAGLEPVLKAVPKAEPAEQAFQEAVRSATVAGVGIVRSSHVTRDGDDWHPPSWTETVQLARQRAIFGSPPAKLTVPCHAAPFRGVTEPSARFRSGQKVLFAGVYLAGKLRGTPALKPWSAEAERAVRDALAPGWMFHRSAVLCPWCRDQRLRRDAGLCRTCGGKTGSGDFAFCPTCAAEAGACQRCKRRIGPASAGVTLRLSFADPRTKAR